MGDVMLPTWLKIARLNTNYLDNTGLTRALYTAKPETTGFGGDRLRLALEFVPRSGRQSAVERAALRAFLVSLRGRQRRAILWDPQYQGPRGSFPTGELLPNNTFYDGSTGWSAGADASLSVQDRGLRVLRTANSSSSVGLAFAQAPAFTTVQYAPYVWRAFIAAVRGTVNAGVSFGGASVPIGANDVGPSAGMRTTTFLATATSGVSAYADNIGALASAAGDYFDVSYASLSRCALVDNGANRLLQSNTLGTTWTPVQLSVNNNNNTAPDGAINADAVTETTNNATHELTQDVIVSSAAADYSIGVAAVGGLRGWCQLMLMELTGNTVISAYLNLTTGAVGTTATGANWSNLRVFTKNLGNGWRAIWLVARKTNGATGLRARLINATADGVNSYAGSAASPAVGWWRPTLAPSSVPTRLVETTSVASAGTSQRGGGLYLKGLPASIVGLLRTDDRFEVITDRSSEMKIVTAPLDSDAAGTGYVQFEPPLMGTPADNAPVIVHNPMTRAIFAGEMVGWEDSPGMLTTASAEFEEAA